MHLCFFLPLDSAVSNRDGIQRHQVQTCPPLTWRLVLALSSPSLRCHHRKVPIKRLPAGHRQRVASITLICKQRPKPPGFAMSNCPLARRGELGWGGKGTEDTWINPKI